MMNLKTIGLFHLLILAALVASSGCTATTGPTLAAAVMTPEPLTPVKTTTPVTPLPVGEIARIKVDHFGMDETTATIYEFVGRVQIDNGPYQSVQVVLQYSDGQEYVYDAGGMGGANATIKSFYLYPDNRYNGKDFEKIIVLDGKKYGTKYNYDKGSIAWVATNDNLLNK
jgi:hypothetical protein